MPQRGPVTGQSGYRKRYPSRKGSWAVPLSFVRSGDGLRISLPAPAEQTQCADPAREQRQRRTAQYFLSEIRFCNRSRLYRKILSRFSGLSALDSSKPPPPAFRSSGSASPHAIATPARTDAAIVAGDITGDRARRGDRALSRTRARPWVTGPAQGQRRCRNRQRPTPGGATHQPGASGARDAA